MTFPMVQKQWESLVELCASLCDSCEISPQNIKGHRDFSNTQCPGDWLYSQLPRLRKDVANKLGQRITSEEVENESPSVNLRLGSSGPAVIKLQQQLLRKGFNPGAIDGDFGENTQTAVINFQRSSGFSAEGIDGIVGTQTRAALGL